MQQPAHWFSRLLRTPVFMYGGLISYSLYLWQQLFDDDGVPIHLQAPFGAIAAIGLAILSYHLIEKPFLRLKDRRAASIPKAPVLEFIGRETRAGK